MRTLISSIYRNLPGRSEAEVLEQLKGRIYFNPDSGKYEIAERVIAGNVIEKADRVERFLDENPDHEGARETLAALREATPKPIAFEDLDFNFGERWIPTGIYDSYASWLFETEVKIGYIADLDEFGITAKDEYNIKIQNQYAVQGEFRRYTGLHLMKHALHNTIPDITKKARKLIDGEWKEVKVRDGEKIQQANIKIDEIRSGFTDWLCDQSADFKERLADMYNRKFNCFVRPKYDGSHLTFPGLDRKALGIEDLYPSQKDAIWMDILLGGGIVDHEVGGGKTLIMCCGTYEKKRIGLVNKPIITGLKANIHEIAKTFCTAYPMARVLYPGREDFTPKKREQIFRQIKNNDWDAVILSHEQFGMIPQSPEVQQEILRAELDSVEQNLMLLKAQGKSVSKRMLTGCLKRQHNLEAKLQKAQYALDHRRDDAVDFRRMGIDHLCVDESHKFKKSDVQYAARPRGGPRQPRREPAGTQHALCPQNHTGAHGARSGGDISVGDDHFQLPHGAVSAVQIPASAGARPAEHPHLRRMGRRIRQKRASITSSRSPTRSCRKNASAISSRFRSWRLFIRKLRISARPRTSVSTARARTRYCTTSRPRPTSRRLSTSWCISPRQAMPPCWAGHPSRKARRKPKC